MQDVPPLYEKSANFRSADPHDMFAGHQFEEATT
jgi:hypothetical protein